MALWDAIISGAVGLGSAWMSSNAQQDASAQAVAAQMGMSKEALDFYKQMYGEEKARAMPYQMAGYGGLQMLTGVDYFSPQVQNALAGEGSGPPAQAAPGQTPPPPPPVWAQNQPTGSPPPGGQNAIAPPGGQMTAPTGPAFGQPQATAPPPQAAPQGSNALTRRRPPQQDYSVGGVDYNQAQAYAAGDRPGGMTHSLPGTNFNPSQGTHPGLQPDIMMNIPGTEAQVPAMGLASILGKVAQSVADYKRPEGAEKTSFAGKGITAPTGQTYADHLNRMGFTDAAKAYMANKAKGMSDTKAAQAATQKARAEAAKAEKINLASKAVPAVSQPQNALAAGVSQNYGEYSDQDFSDWGGDWSYGDAAGDQDISGGYGAGGWY